MTEPKQKHLDSIAEVLKNKIKNQFTGRIVIDMTQGTPVCMEVTQRTRFGK